ncbi:MAG: primosomal protein N' [Gammaproteobacteria bacterium]|nr:primosomal protein N' [Gammaproteobacteria bacterium]
MPETILRVALPTPLMRLFDYLPPDDGPEPSPGQRVRVPFGRSERIGIITELTVTPSVPVESLRRSKSVLDEQPLLDPELRRLLDWASGYYQYPPGEVYAAALPAALRRGRGPATGHERWQPTTNCSADDVERLDKRASLQRRVLAALLSSPDGLDAATLATHSAGWRSAVDALCDKGLVERSRGELWPSTPIPAGQPGPPLNPAQVRAAAAINTARAFAAFLLAGVTGSGKTEVYLTCIEKQLQADRQSLVLVPEIGLTPQLLERFQSRLGIRVAVLHSGLNDSERLLAWTAAATGQAKVIIGTRSAIFTPLPKPGLIIVDEEHDASLKQQEGFRYSARDLAVWRARQLRIPVVLGSATPAFETLENAQSGRYELLELPERPGTATHPSVHLIDLRRHPARDGLSEPLLARIRQHLDANGQVLVYLNRRGFSPVLMCTACGAIAECARCDARMVYHRQRSQVICHHCGQQRTAPEACPDCGEPMLPVGQGTERIETALREAFPDDPLVRIDRDTTRRRGAFERAIAAVRSGEARILLGTQMLTKGHDFPDVTLVGIVDADQGLFGTDFRAGERFAQLFVQVSGRAGRASRPGEVCIQTLYPEHPLLRLLVASDYRAFATQAMAERRQAGWPPFGYLALLRAEASQRQHAFGFLEAARALADDVRLDQVSLLGPAPAPMERRQGRYRGQLLIRADSRARLQSFLQAWRPGLDELREARRARWSLDVDPVELF